MRIISVVTLGVKDLVRSSQFYRSLGFENSSRGGVGMVWFRTGGTVLALYPWDALAQDVGLSPTSSGFRGISLALNLGDKDSVDGMVERARSLGARVVKEPQEVFWGGYSSYFEDPDGHLWEVVWNPFSPVDGSGRLDID